MWFTTIYDQLSISSDGDIIGIEILHVSTRVTNPYEIIGRYTTEADVAR